MNEVVFQPELFERNCAALALRNPWLARTLRETSPDPTVQIEPARDGALTMAIQGRQVLSKYAPLRDAERLTEPVRTKVPPPFAVVVFGFELGMVARQLLTHTTSQVFVVEPHLGVLRATCGASDLTDVLGHERLTLVPSPSGLFMQINYGVGLLPDLSVLVLPGLAALFPAEVERVHERVRELVRDRDIRLTTTLKKSREWLANLFGNFPEFSRLPSVGVLTNACRGVPAVVVSAGPSLDKNISSLPLWKGRGVVISVGTALRKCVAHGVVPDLTVALESNDILSQFRGIDEIRDGFCAFQAKSHPELWRTPSRGTFFFANVHPDSGWMMRFLGEDLAMLSAGGSVSTAAFSLAILLGCNPIVLIGQDLAFGDAGESHAAGIGTGGVENLKAEQLARARQEDLDADPTLCLLDGYYGGRVISKTNLRSYLLWFEENIPIARQGGRRVINATEGGVKIASAEQMPFAEVTATLLGDPFDVTAALAQRHVPPVRDWPRLLREVKDRLRELRDLLAVTDRAKHDAIEVQRLLDQPGANANAIDRIIRRIEKEEKRLGRLLPPLNNLLTVASDQGLLLVNTCFDYTGLDRVATLRMNMKQTATMQHTLHEAAELVRQHLETMAEFLEKQAAGR